MPPLLCISRCKKMTHICMLRIKIIGCGRRGWGLSRMRSTIITLLLGCGLMVLLHILITSQFVDEAAYFSSLPIPDSSNLSPFGIDHIEQLPSTGSFHIPKIIHQTWKSDHVPNSLVTWIKSWVRNHPDWEYWLWTDSSARQLIQDRHPSLLPVYDAYPKNIQRADALRYVVLLEFGGVYADMDMESLRPLDPLTFQYSCFVGQEPYAHPVMDTNTYPLVINALLACRPAHPFMKAVVHTLPDFAHMWSLLDSTGPHFLTYVFKKYTRDHPQYSPRHINGTYLAPAEYFYPNSDPEKFEYFYEKCKGYETLSSLQRRACLTLKKSRSAAERRSLAFTVHHWIHTYLTVKVSLRQPVPIQEVVPNVKIYS